jgi:deoxyribonuclease V
LFLVDAHGFAHPYHCGLASHLGLILRKPVIGVAKNKLIGEIKAAKSKTDLSLIEYNQRIVGAAVTTKSGCKPVYVSVGNMISLETAIEIVRHCTKNSRTPEPILMAHSIATAEKRKINILSDIKNRYSE